MRRFPNQSIKELSSLLGIRTTEHTYPRLCEYSVYYDIHTELEDKDLPQEVRNKVRAKLMARHPDEYEFYMFHAAAEAVDASVRDEFARYVETGVKH